MVYQVHDILKIVGRLLGIFQQRQNELENVEPECVDAFLLVAVELNRQDLDNRLPDTVLTEVVEGQLLIL